MAEAKKTTAKVAETKVEEKQNAVVKPATKVEVKKEVEKLADKKVETVEKKVEEKTPAKSSTAKTVAKAPAKKTTPAAKKAPAKTTTSKAATAKSTEGKKATTRKITKISTKVCLEYKELKVQLDTVHLEEKVKDIWVNEWKFDLKDLENIELYIKPEDRAVYFVANEGHGCFELE